MIPTVSLLILAMAAVVFHAGFTRRPKRYIVFIAAIYVALLLIEDLTGPSSHSPEFAGLPLWLDLAGGAIIALSICGLIYGAGYLASKLRSSPPPS